MRGRAGRGWQRVKGTVAREIIAVSASQPDAANSENFTVAQRRPWPASNFPRLGPAFVFGTDYASGVTSRIGSLGGGGRMKRRRQQPPRVPAADSPERKKARTLFVVSRYHAELYRYLKERFAGDGAVMIILDRRVAERRRVRQVIAVDRRRRERRSRPDIDAELQQRSHAIITLS
jgi:hypothetical protein